MSLELPKIFTPLCSEKGRKIFLETSNSSKDYCKSFWKLSQNYETQITGTYCGIASIVMILNSIGTTKKYRPPSSSAGTFLHFDQKNLFDEETSKVYSEKYVGTMGMPFFKLEELLKAQKGISQKSYLGTEISVSDFRKIASQALLQNDKENFIILYYDRAVLGMAGSYHVSPICGYNEENDMFLLMDVARFKYETAWVSAEELYKSINVKSNLADGYMGGFVIVSPDEKNTGTPTKPKPFLPTKILMILLFIVFFIFTLGVLTGKYLF